MDIFDILVEKEDQIIMDHLATLINPDHTLSICDYGCGDGRMLKKLCHGFPPGIRYTGIDNWSDETNKSSIPNNEKAILYVDNTQPDYDIFLENHQFNLVYSSYALHHFRYPVQELKRLEKLVAPGGHLVLVDMYRDYTDPEKLAENVILFNAQMTTSFRGGYHRVPFTGKEISDLLLALDMETIEQKVSRLGVTQDELQEYQKAVPLWYTGKLKNEYTDDQEENRHPAFMDLFESAGKLTGSIIDSYGANPDHLLITTLKKE